MRLFGNVAEALTVSDAVPINGFTTKQDFALAGLNQPVIISMVVDLPDPFGPR